MEEGDHDDDGDDDDDVEFFFSGTSSIIGRQHTELKLKRPAFTSYNSVVSL